MSHDLGGGTYRPPDPEGRVGVDNARKTLEVALRILDARVRRRNPRPSDLKTLERLVGPYPSGDALDEYVCAVVAELVHKRDKCGDRTTLQDTFEAADRWFTECLKQEVLAVVRGDGAVQLRSARSADARDVRDRALKALGLHIRSHGCRH